MVFALFQTLKPFTLQQIIRTNTSPPKYSIASLFRKFADMGNVSKPSDDLDRILLINHRITILWSIEIIFSRSWVIINISSVHKFSIETYCLLWNGVWNPAALLSLAFCCVDLLNSYSKFSAVARWWNIEGLK